MTRVTGSRRVVGLIAAGGLALAACGGGDDGDAQPQGTDAPAATTAEEPTDETSASIAPDTAPTEDTTATAAEEEFDISMVQPSVVKIYAEGSFVDPEFGLQLNAAGVGSGAIVSDDGLVVTNNHVVTGAALLRVYLEGDDEPTNARVLGVSECSDLAVIQLEGDGYPALGYREEPVTAGVDVFAAGFPGSDAVGQTNEEWIESVDYTLTRGIVSNTTSSGETSWASVDEVIEHDARIRGGNSGGPLVDDRGNIVAFNYSGIQESDQNYAIAADDALAIIERLQAGEDVDSIGVNGQAVFDDAADISGIWVANVKSGSPADIAGIEPGDIITRLEGLLLAVDGTMSDYCDVIRTQGADATMDIEVLRYATEEVLEGQLNGNPLAQSFSFAQEFEEEVAQNEPSDPSDTYTSYVTVTDDGGTITVDVPAEWADVDGTFNEDFGPSLYAAPDLDEFLNSWTVPGLILEGTAALTAADLDATLDQIDLSEQCEYGGRQPYSDPLYSGSLDVWLNCGGIGTTVFGVAVSPEDGSFVARMLIQVVEPRDLDAADTIFNTFVVTP